MTFVLIKIVCFWLFDAGVCFTRDNLHFFRVNDFIVVRVFEFHVPQDASPDIVTVAIDLQLAFERVASPHFG